MSRDLEQLLNETAAAPTRPVDIEYVVRAVRRRRVTRRSFVGVAAVSAVTIIAVSAAVALRPDGGAPRPQLPVTTAPEAVPRQPASFLLPQRPPAGMHLEYANTMPPGEDSQGYLAAYTGKDGAAILAVTNTGSETGPAPVQRTHARLPQVEGGRRPRGTRADRRRHLAGLVAPR